MKIEVMTKPYEVTDKAGVRAEKLYMSKVRVSDDGDEWETILAYHINTKNYFLLKREADQENLSGSFAFTEHRDLEIEKEFLKINNKSDVKSGKSSSNWFHIKI